MCLAVTSGCQYKFLLDWNNTPHYCRGLSGEGQGGSDAGYIHVPVMGMVGQQQIIGVCSTIQKRLSLEYGGPDVMLFTHMLTHQKQVYNP